MKVQSQEKKLSPILNRLWKLGDVISCSIPHSRTAQELPSFPRLKGYSDGEKQWKEQKKGGEATFWLGKCKLQRQTGKIAGVKESLAKVTILRTVYSPSDPHILRKHQPLFEG